VSVPADPPALLDVRLDEHGRASLDGTWALYPGDHDRAALPGLEPAPIRVPGLWEAQGHLELDGVAWYRLRFVLPDADGWWTLRFAAVMDTAQVWLNGALLGQHEHPFTPFELDASGSLVTGVNVLEVRVDDPPLDDPFHIRSAHGKQGWANHVFPSRPSLYMTYGGIWQSVTLRRHGAAVTRDVFVNSDPDDLVVTVEVRNVTASPVTANVGLRALDLVREDVAELAPHGTAVLTFGLGATSAARWTPGDPVLHSLLLDVQVDGVLADRRRVRFGLRTVRVEGTRLLVNDEPYRMKSALVQGFRAEELYAEGPREAIVEEVRAARDLGFTMLRLHIKAFDPAYLEVCDELGMLVHCDLPVAEPIAHEEIGDGTQLSRRCVDAVGEQVRRDRNHPCIVLWSAMNELGLDREGVRDWDVYEQFARTLYAAVTELDPTRPCIENDWVEPSPERVFRSPILTAHWYGRLHADYLDRLERQAAKWKDCGRPLFVTEFGDWGLPEMARLADAPFWDTYVVYASGLAGTLWPATIACFVRETQRYQGLSDRLQMEVFRRHDHLGGYCLTELTDVPHEFNGVLDLHRRPKPLAAEEIRRGNQPVLAMLHLPSLVAGAGEVVEAPLHVSNDGPALGDVEVRVRFGNAVPVDADRLLELDTSGVDAERLEQRFSESVAAVRVGSLASYAVTSAGTVSLPAPHVAGSHDLLVEVCSGGHVVSENRYPVHVVTRRTAPYDVALTGAAGDATATALDVVGALVRDDAPVLVVAEGGLDAAGGTRAAAHLRGGGTVLVLEQEPAAAEHYPVGTRLAAVETAWGSSVFHFTTDSGALPSLPRRNVLVAEESTVQARSVVAQVGDRAFPDEPVVIAYKPVPGSLTGTVVGGQAVGHGRLLLCQYRLVDRAARGDAAAGALLTDLVTWAAAPRPRTVAERTVKNDGRALTYYSFPAPGAAS
jgi:hypothetical protein